jgi:membrane protein implicated in regulation of membrane protease activity
VSRNSRDVFFDGPGFMCLNIAAFGWTAASTGHDPWLRGVAAVILAVWVALLVRFLVRRDRARSAERRRGAVEGR